MMKSNSTLNSFRWALVLVVSLFHIASLGAAPQSWELDFQELFINEEQAQIGGSCHVYAAASLFEAACFQASGGWKRNARGEYIYGAGGEKVAIGKRLYISRAYLFYKHLKSKVQKADSATELVAPHYASSEDRRNIFKFDSGSIYDDLLILQTGSICSVNAFPFGSTFTESLKDAQGTVVQFYEKKWGLNILDRSDDRQIFEDKLTNISLGNIEKIRAAYLRYIDHAASEQLQQVGRYKEPSEIESSPDVSIPDECKIGRLTFHVQEGDIAPITIIELMRRHQIPVAVSTTTYDDENPIPDTRHVVIIAAIGKDRDGEWWALYLDTYDRIYKVARKLVSVRRVIYYTIN